MGATDRLFFLVTVYCLFHCILQQSVTPEFEKKKKFLYVFFNFGVDSNKTVCLVPVTTLWPEVKGVLAVGVEILELVVK